jgi:hypothetical protein
MIDKYRLEHLRRESGEKGELARWVIQLQKTWTMLVERKQRLSD